MVVAFRYQVCTVYSIYIYIYSVYTYTLYPLVDRVVTPQKNWFLKKWLWLSEKTEDLGFPKTNLRSQILASKEISSLPFSWDSKKHRGFHVTPR